MEKTLLKRHEVPLEQTWDLSGFFTDEKQYLEKLEQTEIEVTRFESMYKGQLSTPEAIRSALLAYQSILESLGQLSAYRSLSLQVDQTDEISTKAYGDFSIRYAAMRNQLTFLDSELIENPEASLAEIIQDTPELAGYLNDLLREKPHRLSKEVEAALAKFSQVFANPYQAYNQSKLADIPFKPFTVNGTEYPQSFVLFENEWEYDVRHEVRHGAYASFYGELASYQHAFASFYKAQVLEEKAQASLRGFDSVIDYLLFPQKVTREMYDRQIDTIISELAPAMRRFAGLLQQIHGLPKMSYADLKLPVDHDFEPEISIEESRIKILEGLAPLGEDYLAMVNRAFDERWIDFPQNIGKSTGAFCNSTYGVHPYILISWTKRMREVFVLAHELGHGGHFYLAHQNQNIFNSRPSLYFIEAPSTMNELIVANDMISKTDEPRMTRWVYASMISRTYYHNFVTHLLEAAYQREVYRAVDRGESLSASVLNNLTLGVLREFWGDAVDIEDYAGLTWMRQPHYYMGLYPYTYSAGLTISTSAMQKINRNEVSIDDWKNMLRAGGTKTPSELAAMVKVDLSTDQPLKETIAYITAMIDDIIMLTEKLSD